MALNLTIFTMVPFIGQKAVLVHQKGIFSMTDKLDKGADALRRYEQSGKRLNDWESLPRSTKEKWREKVRIVLSGMEEP